MNREKRTSIGNINKVELREKELSELGIVFSTLEKDISDIYPYEKTDDELSVRYRDPCYLDARERRSVVRSIFAFLEGNCFCLRRTLVRNFEDNLSHAQLMALKEEQYEIDANGKIQIRQAKVSLLKLIRLTAASASELFPAAKGLECRGAQFESLVRAVKVRDRLMHPRSSEHLEVSDEEIRDAVKGYVWFHSIMICILIQVTRSLENLAKDLKKRYGEIVISKSTKDYEP